MVNQTLLVTGASGHLGRLALGELLGRSPSSHLVATTRHPNSLADLAAKGVEVRYADFDDPASLEIAFRGLSRALLVSTDALATPGQRITQHTTAIRALLNAGAEHIVYTSLPNPHGTPVLLGPDHAATEANLLASGIEYTILRNNIYADYLVPSLTEAVATGKYVNARGTGKVAWVTRQDCAGAAAGALVAARGRAVLDVTGPEPLSSADVAEIAAELAKKPIVHVSVSKEELKTAMLERGTPQPLAALFTSLDDGVEKGLFANVTDTVQRYAGRAPLSVRSFLATSALAR
ncbi:MAG TPA: SDR family oxidoreductase [Polyangiaceae bacterium]|nr:SDR family oxidoreductase [Polyangiaceae bacterium]